MKSVRLKYILFMVAVLVPVLAQAQAKITTKRARLSDFPVKTTKVVLTGDDLTDLALTGDIISRWRISPFEFCDRAYFESHRYETGYYYLYLSSEKSGIMSLNLYKGGKKNAPMSTDGCLNVMKIPTDRENLTIAIDILQRYVDGVILNESSTLSEPYIYNGRLIRHRGSRIFIAREDLCPDSHGLDSLETYGKGIIFTDEVVMDRIREHAPANCLIGICISSPQPSRKAVAVRMIVTADSHELCYFRERKMRSEGARGFSENELKRIKNEHKYRSNEKRQN